MLAVKEGIKYKKRKSTINYVSIEIEDEMMCGSTGGRKILVGAFYRNPGAGSVEMENNGQMTEDMIEDIAEYRQTGKEMMLMGDINWDMEQINKRAMTGC